MSVLLREKALVALNVVVLLGSVAWAVLRLRPGPAALPAALAASAPKGMPVVAEVRIDQIEAQPLFHRSRQPPRLAEASIASAVAPPPAPPPPLPVLLGVAGSAGQLGALLEDGPSARRQLVRAGQLFGAWTVVEVRSRQVRLRDGNNTVAIVLRPGLPGPQTGAASPAVPLQ